MSTDPNEPGIISNVTEDECFDRWQGVSWEADEDDSDKGICKSDYDFDGWASEYEGDSDEN